MKITLNVDDDLLGRVMKANGITNKTKAIDLALREMDRRAELFRLTTEGLGMSSMELREVFDPASEKANDPIREASSRYGRKSRSSR